MSIKTYNSIVGSCNVSNFFDIYDDDLNKIRFSLKDQVLYITSYNIIFVFNCFLALISFRLCDLILYLLGFLMLLIIVEHLVKI